MSDPVSRKPFHNYALLSRRNRLTGFDDLHGDQGREWRDMTGVFFLCTGLFGNYSRFCRCQQDKRLRDNAKVQVDCAGLDIRKYEHAIDRTSIVKLIGAEGIRDCRGLVAVTRKVTVYI